MFKIIKKRVLGDKLVLFDIEAEKITKSCLPGQFIIVKLDEQGERIPLTICDYDGVKGILTIVVQEIGASTKKINMLNEGDSFQDVVGPLGNPSDLVEITDDELKNKNIVFIGGGVGVAPIYPQVKYLS